MRMLGAFSALIAAVAVAVGSSASFTASSANPSNTFAAGTLSILNSKEGLAVLHAHLHDGRWAMDEAGNWLHPWRFDTPHQQWVCDANG